MLVSQVTCRELKGLFLNQEGFKNSLIVWIRYLECGEPRTNHLGRMGRQKE